MAHEQAEEETLFNTLERLPGIRDEVVDALRVQNAIKHMTLHLRQDTTPDDVQWRPRMCQLRDVITDYMSHEEEKILCYALNTSLP